MPATSSRCALLTAPHTLRVVTRPQESLEPWQARVRVDLVGVCGTDRALVAGTLPAPLPLVPGHEFVGTVVEVARTEHEAWLGKRVCADINNTCVSRGSTSPCRACRACRIGLVHHCQRRNVTGIFAAAGAFAEFVSVPVANLFEVPEEIDDRRAVFCEPLAAALQTFVQVPVGPGDVVAVLGPGRLGCLIAAVAHRQGAQVLAVGRNRTKLRACAQLGVGEVVEAEVSKAGNPAVRDHIDRLSEGLGADVVVEATGHPEGLAAAQTMVRPRGTIVLKTTCGLPPEGFDVTRAVVDEVSLVGSRCGPFAAAMTQLADPSLGVERLIEASYGLAEVSTAIARAREVMKVVVNPQAP
ncbi:MAG: alcohol dehydrogenase catalytic domain-containing protein [Nannocystaceae bacterium]